MLAEQNYPNFEIVLIDDASSDSTLDRGKNNTQYPFGKKIMKHFSNKKYALTLE
jgi:glycosyltransferase involved in cell wall biosynthesis